MDHGDVTGMDIERQERELRLKSEHTLVSGSARRCSACGHSFAANIDVCPNDGTELERNVPATFPFKDKFKFMAELGSGGMGAVYKAYNPLINKCVAIKVLHPHMSADKMLRRFQNEARAISGIDNPHIVRLLDFGVSDFGQPYMVMDFVDGQSLSAVLKCCGTLPLDQTLSIVMQICDGMGIAHAQGVFHRDLKPSNIIFNPDDKRDPAVKVIDFGIAKMLESEDGAMDKLTSTGEVFGSPLYMSPEQARGLRSDQRSDIYSLGCMMYEMLTGCPPIVGASPVETIMRQLTDEAPRLSQGSLKERFPSKLEAIVAKCLAKSPDQRYQSMSELAHDIRSFHRLSKSELARQDQLSAVAKPKKQARKLPAKMVRAGAALLLVGAAVCLTIVAVSNWATKNSAHLQSVTNRDFESDLDSLKLRSAPKKQAQKQPPKENPFVDLTGHSKGETAATDDAYIDEKISGWSKKTGLRLDGTSVTDKSLKEIAQLKHLETLMLNNTKITATGLSFLEAMTTLKKLEISRCAELNAKDLQVISRLHWLRFLNLSNTKVDDEAVKEIAQLPYLETLRLDGTNITGNGLKWLVQAQNLQSLTLSKCKNIGPDDFKVLGELRTLKYCDLNDTNTGDESLQGIGELVGLETLLLNGTNISGSGLQSLHGMQKLRVLYVGKCSHILPADFQYIDQLLALTEVDSYSSDMQDAGLLELKDLKLKRLRASGAGVTDAGLVALKGMPIDCLCLGASKITDAGVQELRALPITELIIYGDKGVTDKSVDTFIEMKLHHINVTDTGITRSGIEKLKQKVAKVDA